MNYACFLVSGQAGSGKSHLINALASAATTMFGAESVAICAPTALAAHNVGGQTCHRLFKLTVLDKGRGYYHQKLCETVVKDMRAQIFNALRLLIIGSVD